MPTAAALRSRAVVLCRGPRGRRSLLALGLGALGSRGGRTSPPQTPAAPEHRAGRGWSRSSSVFWIAAWPLSAGRLDARLRGVNAGGGPAALRAPPRPDRRPRLSPGPRTPGDPFFSPDGQWIAFFADGKLKKVALTGGADRHALRRPRRSWRDVGRGRHDLLHALRQRREGACCAFRRREGPRSPSPEPTRPLEWSTDRWPQALPGGRAILFTSYSTYERFRRREPRRPAAGRAGRARSCTAAVITAAIVQQRPPGLHPQGDALRRSLRPRPSGADGSGRARAGRRRCQRPGTAGAHFAVLEPGDCSRTCRAPSIGGARCPSSGWTAKGRRRSCGPRPRTRSTSASLPTAGGWRWTSTTEPSATCGCTSGNGTRCPASRSIPGNDNNPVWTPDGRRIVFSSARADKRAEPLPAARRTARGGPASDREHEPAGPLLVASRAGSSWSSSEQNPQTNLGPHDPAPRGDRGHGLEAGEARGLPEQPASRMRGGLLTRRALAGVRFQRERTRTRSTCVPFPGPGGKWQVSTGGGRSRDVVVDAARSSSTGPASAAEAHGRRPTPSKGTRSAPQKPRVWSPTPVRVPADPYRPFDLHPDGQRFAVLKSLMSQPETKRDHLTLIVGFADELRRIAPAGTR